MSWEDGSAGKVEKRKGLGLDPQNLCIVGHVTHVGKPSSPTVRQEEKTESPREPVAQLSGVHSQ